MSDSPQDPQPSSDSTVAAFPSLPPVPEAEELPQIKQIVDLRDTSHADLAAMGFTDSQYDAAVASGSIALVDEHQLTPDDLRAMNDQMKRVLAFCETQRENPLRLQAKINDLEEQLRQAIAEKNYWMKRCKDLT
ncbi:NAD Kinase, partial [Phytophthora palmivora]